MPNKNRAKLAKLVESIGGYSRYGEGPFALEWNVGVYESLEEDFASYMLQVDTLNEFTNYHGKLTHEDMPVLKRAIKLAAKEWKRAVSKGWLWERVLEAMREEVTDCDTIYYISPKIAEEFNISQDYKFDVEFEFHGRGGKHLCLTRFEGYSLKLSNDTLVEILTNSGKQGDDTGRDFPNNLCNLLLAYLTECNLMFSQQRVRESFAYNQRFEAQRILEAAWPEAREKYEKQQAKKEKLKAKLLRELTTTTTMAIAHKEDQ